MDTVWYYFYLWLQRVMRPPLRIFFFGIFRITIEDPHGVLKTANAPLIIASNHKTPIDPFIIGLAFPWRSRIFPMRFMAEFKYFDNPKIEFLRKIGLIYLIYFLFGAFPSRRGEGIERAIELPTIFLKQKESVLMFPEGRMMPAGELGDFKRGTAALALRSGVPILPVALSYKNRTYRLAFGRIFSLQNPAGNNEDGTAAIREKISEIYARTEQNMSLFISNKNKLTLRRPL